jgi:hypothetical protein
MRISQYTLYYNYKIINLIITTCFGLIRPSSGFFVQYHGCVTATANLLGYNIYNFIIKGILTDSHK